MSDLFQTPHYSETRKCFAFCYEKSYRQWSCMPIIREETL
jgi:hypothetical protein